MNTRFVCFVLALSCLAGFAKPPLRYQFIPLGTLPGGTLSTAVKINNKNQVVGISNTRAGQYRAFVWEDGRMRDLGAPSGGLVYVSDINDHGQIVGNFPGAYFGSSNLPAPEGYGSLSGSALNNSGDVVGVMRHLESGALVGFVYENATVRRLPALAPEDYFSQPFSINASGDIVGFAQSGNDAHPVIWSGNQIIDLSTMPGSPMIQASDINNLGHACGWSVVATQDEDAALTTFHASLYKDNFVHDLGSLPNMRFSSAVALNDADAVIGLCQNETPEDAVPFVYSDRTMYNVRQVTVAAKGWDIIRLTDINNNGWIIGFAFKDQLRQAFVLRPIGR